MSMSEQDRHRISAAIHAVEERSSGEIVCVLAQTSSDATALPIFVASVVALALPWVLDAWTALAVIRILSLQVLAFAVLVLVLCAPSVRVALLPRRVRRAAAHRAALEQFMIRGVSRKKDRNGILIFVSLAERYARIIADDGIASRVSQSEWQSAIEVLLEHTRDGRTADGFIEAIARCGRVLESHFPRSDESMRDELPDRIYLV
jgi:putative membrane protein